MNICLNLLYLNELNVLCANLPILFDPKCQFFEFVSIRDFGLFAGLFSSFMCLVLCFLFLFLLCRFMWQKISENSKEYYCITSIKQKLALRYEDIVIKQSRCTYWGRTWLFDYHIIWIIIFVSSYYFGILFFDNWFFSLDI